MSFFERFFLELTPNSVAYGKRKMLNLKCYSVHAVKASVLARDAQKAGCKVIKQQPDLQTKWRRALMCNHWARRLCKAED